MYQRVDRASRMQKARPWPRTERDVPPARRARSSQRLDPTQLPRRRQQRQARGPIPQWGRTAVARTAEVECRSDTTRPLKSLPTTPPGPREAPAAMAAPGLPRARMSRSVPATGGAATPRRPRIAHSIRRISRTTSRPTVTIRDMSRRWPHADWRLYAERTGGSVSIAETPQPKGMQEPSLTRCRKMLPPGEGVTFGAGREP
jgi:hypothetical protein